MARISIFADESGNFDFSRKRDASRYFILTTIACPGYGVGDALLALRRDLAWEGIGVDSEFHATTDKLEVRARVFALLQQHQFAWTRPSSTRPSRSRRPVRRTRPSTSTRGTTT